MTDPCKEAFDEYMQDSKVPKQYLAYLWEGFYVGWRDARAFLAQPEQAEPVAFRPFHIGVQNDQPYIISGRAPALNNDYPNHEADRTCVAKIYDEAEAKRLVEIANSAAPPQDRDTAERTRASLHARNSVIDRCAKVIEDEIDGGDECQQSDAWLSELARRIKCLKREAIAKEAK